MNLFFLDSDPVTAASLYCDEHLGKIRLEASQMLSTAYHLSPHVTVEEKDGLCYVQGNRIYKKAFVNHPTCVWVRTAKSNFDWALEHLKALQKIWVATGNNGDITDIMITSFSRTRSLLRLPQGMTDVPLAMYEEVKAKYKSKEPLAVAVQAYRDYMCAKVFKNNKRPTWTINKQPEWYSYDS
jgi:hypothetical protein